MLISFAQRCNQYLVKFYDVLDPIKNVIVDKENEPESFVGQFENRQPKVDFSFGIAIILYLAVDTLTILYRERIFHESAYSQIQHIPDLFTHRIFPKLFWHEADIIAFLCLLMAMAVYCLLMGKCMLKREYCMFAIEDGQTQSVVKLLDAKGVEFPAQLSEQLLRYRRIGRKMLTYLVYSILLTMQLYFTQQIWFQRLFSLSHLCFYFIFLPTMLFYAVLADVVVFSFFVFTCKYIQIKQQFLQQQMLRYELHCLKATTNVHKLKLKWRHVVYLNMQINKLCHETRGHNHFWSAYMTVFFLCFLILIVYYGYCFLFIESTWLMKAFFSIFFNYDCIFLLFVLGQSRLIVQRHAKMNEANGTFCQFFIFSNVVKRKAASILVKAGSCLMNRQLKMGFYFLNDWLIDSNVFLMTAYYLTTLCMVIFIK